VIVGDDDPQGYIDVWQVRHVGFRSVTLRRPALLPYGEGSVKVQDQVLATSVCGGVDIERCDYFLRRRSIITYLHA
jgi:hypothetical protein